jgi:O-antigen ligase
MQEPSFLAGFLCFSIVLTIMLLAGERLDGRIIRPALYGSLLLQSLCLVLTTSTGGFLGFAASLIAAVVLLRGPVRRRFVTLTVLMALVLLGPVIYVAMGSSLARNLATATVGKPTHVSAIERTIFVVTALEMFLDHPLLGVGPGLYNEHARKYTSALGQLRVVIPNNVYAELLSETGILGFVSFMALLYGVWRHALWKWRGSDRSDVLAASLLIALVSLAVQFMAYPTFKMEFIWLLFGLSLARWKPAKTSDSLEASVI